jgi:hypothetical protein
MIEYSGQLMPEMAGRFITLFFRSSSTTGSMRYGDKFRTICIERGACDFLLGSLNNVFCSR